MDAALWGFIGTCLGALISLGASWMNNRHQDHREERKFAAQQEKERRERLREKLEEAHQLLSKIGTDTTPQASRRMRATDLTFFPEQYDKSHEDVRRLRMITDLYFPQLQEPVEALAKLTISFWITHQNATFLEGVEDSTRFKNDRNAVELELSKASQEIGPKVIEAKKKLSEAATFLSITGS